MRVGARPWHLLLASALAATSGCRCTTCAPSAAVERTAGSHRVRIEGQAAHEWGVDGIGAPHVGGVIWPTVKGAGYAIHVIVDDRPKVFVDAGSKMPSEDELRARIEGIELASAPDDRHLGVRVEPGGDWRVMHLLPRGVPFESSHSTPGKEIPWPSMPAPEQIAMAEMREVRCRLEKSCALLWSAVASQAPGPPLDDVLLEVWPGAEPAGKLAIERARPAAAAPEPWRKAAAAKALSTLDDTAVRRAGFDLLVALEDPEALGKLDRKLVDIWRAEGTSDSHASFVLLESRLSTKPKEAKGPPMAPAGRAYVVAVARELIREKPRTVDCGELLILAGTPEDAAWMDDALLEVWPYNDETCLACDGSHELLEKRAEGWGPPVTADWRERATDKAARVAQQPGLRFKADRLLLALDTDRAVAIALDNWLAVWPEVTDDQFLVLKVASRASPAWKQRAVGKGHPCIDRFSGLVAATERWRVPDEECWRAHHCIELVVALDGEAMSCDRWREVARLADAAHHPANARKLPERCSGDGG